MAPPLPVSSPRTRAAALAIAVGCIALQLGGELSWAALSLALWLGTLVVVDRGALARLRMPRFWLITIVLALGSGLLLGPRDLDVAGLRLSEQGLRAGALMVVRGAFVFGLASWATRATSSSSAQRIARRFGLESLVLSVTTAFGVLPAIRDRLVERREAARGRGLGAHPLRLAEEVIGETVELTRRLTAEMVGQRAVLVAVLGKKGAGKTTALRGLIAALEARGLVVGGVVQPPVEGEGRRLGYDVLDLMTGKRRPLARRGRSGRFEFSDDVFKWAGGRLRDAHASSDVVTVDELGLLEAKGRGHLDALLPLSGEPGRAGALVAAVREGCLESISELLGEPVLTLTPPLEPGDVERASETIGALVRERQGVARRERAS